MLAIPLVTRASEPAFAAPPLPEIATEPEVAETLLTALALETAEE